MVNRTSRLGSHIPFSCTHHQRHSYTVAGISYLVTNTDHSLSGLSYRVKTQWIGLRAG